MRELPKCKLCGCSAAVVIQNTTCCTNRQCVIFGNLISAIAWHALMSPLAVTDAMVERAWKLHGPCMVVSNKGGIRAVLEAALKE